MKAEDEGREAFRMAEGELEKFRQDWLAEVNVKLQREGNDQQPNGSANTDFQAQVDHKAELQGDTLKLNLYNHDIKSLGTEDRHRIALEVYQLAVVDERKGKLGEALVNYRRAFKLNPDVDLAYRAYLRRSTREEGEYRELAPFIGTEEEFEFTNHLYLNEDYAPSQIDSGEASPEKREINWEKLDPMHTLIQTFLDEDYRLEAQGLEDKFDQLQLEEKGLRKIQFEPADPERACYLMQLPDSLMLRVLHFLQLSDIQAVGRFSCTCIKGLFLARDNVLWATYGKMLYHPATALYRSFRLKLPTTPLQTYVDRWYGGRWRLFLIDYPRVRFDGLYISTCTYIRQGASEETFSQPIHLITYFRYLRFYPDGTCLSLLTVSEPSQVVHRVYKGSPIREMLAGNYALLPNEVDISVGGPHRPGITFHLSLELKSTSRGRHNKLSWLGYHSRDKEDVTYYSLKQFKPYYFSKVRSYKVDWSFALP